MDKISGQIIRAFSPAIGKYKISESLIKIINDHIDIILEDQNKIEELYHGKNLAGDNNYGLRYNQSLGGGASMQAGMTSSAGTTTVGAGVAFGF